MSFQLLGPQLRITTKLAGDRPLRALGVVLLVRDRVVLF
jgi:hypothetical protein